MEISSANYNCLPHLGMEDSNIFGDEYYYQYGMDSLMGYPVSVDEVELASSLSGSGESYSTYKCLNSKRSVESPESVAPRATKQPKTATSSCVSDHLMPPKPIAASNSSSSRIISFEKNSNSPSLANSSHDFYNLHSTLSVDKRNPKVEIAADPYNENLNFSSLLKYDTPTTKPTTNATRNPVQAQDHVMAERKRREKLSQRFIALSAILPGLKKMDKASVLGHAIKHVQILQERVKILEEQVAKNTVESAVYVKRSVVSTDDCTGTLSSDGNYDQPLPEIEARVSGKDVLIRIHCAKYIACAPIVLSELQKLHLTVQSSSFLPFGTTAIHITIVAQVDKEYLMTAKEIVKRLRQVLREII